eukprot:TRINITY_DN589_c0_g1_i1.p2 TRINITY_DN589_c0_g1~~TRINITY_DN589_c0_g1_i1.p2  ORF type:complete len:154 (+),score=43.56 TRINITY_DN589_c0_g1_i1:136-597(+)
MAKRSVLLAIDKSKEAAYVVDWALENLIRPDDQVTLLYVAKSGGLLRSSSSKKSAEGAAEGQSGLDFLDEAENKLRQNESIDVQRMVRNGDARAEIVAAAEETKASMLIMGSRGATLLKKTHLIGSVSDYCTVNAPCPVTVVKPKAYKNKDAA